MKNHTILKSRTQRLGLAAGLLVFLAIALLPSGLHRIEGFGSRPAYAAAVAALMAVWWFTEALPMAWTAAAPLVLFPILGVFDDGFARSALKSGAPYVDAYIFLFLGGMMIGASMEQWNLHRRIALHIMRFIGTEASPWRRESRKAACRPGWPSTCACWRSFRCSGRSA